MKDTVECTVCGEKVGRMGIAQHAGMHKRRFREVYGRGYEDYDEVREKYPFGDAPDEQHELGEYE